MLIQSTSIYWMSPWAILSPLLEIKRGPEIRSHSLGIFIVLREEQKSTREWILAGAHLQSQGCVQSQGTWVTVHSRWWEGTSPGRWHQRREVQEVLEWTVWARGTGSPAQAGHGACVQVRGEIGCGRERLVRRWPEVRGMFFQRDGACWQFRGFYSSHYLGGSE